MLFPPSLLLFSHCAVFLSVFNLKTNKTTTTELPYVRYIKVKSFSIIPYRAIRDEKESAKKSKRFVESTKKKAHEATEQREDATTTNTTSGTVSSSHKEKREGKEKRERGDKKEKDTERGDDQGSDELSRTLESIEEIEELLDVDGELKGCTPFTCEVIRHALRVML